MISFDIKKLTNPLDEFTLQVTSPRDSYGLGVVLAIHDDHGWNGDLLPFWKIEIDHEVIRGTWRQEKSGRSRLRSCNLLSLLSIVIVIWQTPTGWLCILYSLRPPASS